MKPAQGIEISAILGSTLMSQRYVPPSKRKEEAKKPPTSVDLSSDTIFPSLAQMKPTSPGATWGELRTRLTEPNNFKNVVEECIKREIDDAYRQATITDPFAMTEKEREANGWLLLPRRSVSILPQPVEQEMVYPALDPDSYREPRRYFAPFKQIFPPLK